jgi:ubiquitin-protein ligase
MIYTYIKKIQKTELLKKLVYYLNMEKIKYKFVNNDIQLIINDHINITIMTSNGIFFLTNCKLLFSLINRINENKYFDGEDNRIEDSVSTILQHIKINKKLNEISLTKTLNLLKNEYFRYKECKSYEYWQILTLNASLIEINRKNKYEILSLIKYPIIEIIQKHEIDNKKIIIYIKYNFLNIYPLEININCNNKLKYNLLDKIEDLYIFKSFDVWKDDYNLSFINDKIYNIIDKYGSIDNDSDIVCIMNETKYELDYTNNIKIINDGMLIKEIDNTLSLNNENNWNAKKYGELLENKKIKVNEKINILLNYVKENEDVYEKYINDVKEILKEYLLNWNYDDEIMNKIIDVVLVNLNKFKNNITYDLFIINEINSFFELKNISFRIDNENESDDLFINKIEHKNLNLYDMNEDMNSNKKRKIGKNNIVETNNVITTNDDLYEIDLKSRDELELNDINALLKKTKNDDINQTKIDYEFIIENDMLLNVNEFKNFEYDDIIIQHGQNKRLGNEIKIIKKNIINTEQSSMFMRVNKTSKGEMRFMISGPHGTPYENGLFIFDLGITDEFPYKPPKVHFSNNGSKRFNPNLYDCGKVCLSLLGTWAGSESELWNKNISNIFQILISIQSLILTPDPYYNEPGYEETRGTEEGIRLSERYNANIRLYTIDHAMNDLIKDLNSKNPEYLEFHDVIRQHFKYKKNEILEEIEKWKDNIDVVDRFDSIIKIEQYNDYEKSIEEHKKLIKSL